MDKDITRLLAVQEALANEEALLAQAHETLIKAEAEFEIAATKYAALRDLSLECGDGPYTGDGYKLPAMRALTSPYGLINMAAAMAIKMVLAQAEEPVTLDELYERARAGGWNLGSTGRTLRNFNAALMKMTEVEKLKGEKYRLKEPVELPF